MLQSCQGVWPRFQSTPCILPTHGNARFQIAVSVIPASNVAIITAAAAAAPQGVLYGGLPAAVDLVRSGLARPDEFSVMLGLSGWAPGQLEQEVIAGSWYVVAAGQNLVLPHKQVAVAGSKRQNQAPDALWRQVLQMIGKPVKAL